MKAVDAVSKHLETLKKSVSKKEEYAAVATISAQDSEIGGIIAEVIDEVGKDGVVTVEAGQTLGIEKEFVEGMQFDQGYISAYFVTDPQGMKAVFEKPYILITDKKIGSIQEILPLLEAVAQRGRKEIVIIAENVEGEALATLVVNKLRGTFSALAVKAPPSATAGRKFSRTSRPSRAAASFRRKWGSSWRMPRLKTLARRVA